MRNVETFPSKQPYRYLSLVERKVAELYHDMAKMNYFHLFLWTIDGVLGGVKLERLYLTSERWNWQGKSLRRYIVYMHQLAIAIINLHLLAPIKKYSIKTVPQIRLISHN